MSHRDPTHDWDDHVRGEDEAIAAEVAWWRENKDRVLQVACAIIAGEADRRPPLMPQVLIDRARDVVLEITRRAADPYE